MKTLAKFFGAKKEHLLPINAEALKQGRAKAHL
jgi:hypothetical protein